jgi:hypothetical protein
MLTNAKINFKKYIIFSVILLTFSSLFLRSKAEFGVVLLVCLASCANQWMLIFIVRRLTDAAANNSQKDGKLITLMSIGKLLIVFAAISFGVQIMSKRIIIPVLIYVLQIVVLYLSFEKQVSVEKGS